LWEWAAFATFWGEEETGWADLLDADAAAGSWVSKKSLEDVSVFTSNCGASALVIVNGPCLAWWARGGVRAALTTSSAPELTTCAYLLVAFARAGIEVVEVGGSISVLIGAVHNIALACAVILTPEEACWALVWSTFACTRDSVPVVSHIADLGYADALALRRIPKSRLVSASLRSTLACAIADIEVLWLTIVVSAHSVSTSAFAIVLTEVIARIAANIWCTTDASTKTSAPDFVGSARSLLAMASAGLNIKVLVFTAGDWSTFAPA